MKINNKLLSAGLGLSLLLGLSACGNDNQQFFSFQSFSLSTIAEGADNDSVKDEIENFSGKWDVSVSGIQPVKVGPNVLTELNDTLSTLTCVNFTSDPAVIHLPAELTAVNTNSNDTVTPKSKLVKRLTLDLLNDKVAVFRIYTFAYPEGAAHGLYSNLFVNYDVEAGNILTLSMIFKPGYERTLQPEILRRLKENNSQLLMDDDEINVSQNFRITDDGIEFIYGIYSIAPYSAGEPLVSFNPYELSDILSEKGKTLLGVIR